MTANGSCFRARRNSRRAGTIRENRPAFLAEFVFQGHSDLEPHILVIWVDIGESRSRPLQFFTRGALPARHWITMMSTVSPASRNSTSRPGRISAGLSIYLFHGGSLPPRVGSGPAACGEQPFVKVAAPVSERSTDMTECGSATPQSQLRQSGLRAIYILRRCFGLHPLRPAVARRRSARRLQCRKGRFRVLRCKRHFQISHSIRRKAPNSRGYLREFGIEYFRQVATNYMSRLSPMSLIAL